MPEDLDLNGTELSFTAEVSIYTTWTVQTYEITICLSLTDPVTYSVSFDSNGGSTVVSQTVTSGEAAVVPAAPTRSGYSFVGWYSDENLTAAYDFSTAVTSDFMLYAKWKLNSGSANSSSSNTITTVTNNDDGSITTTVTNKTTGVIKETTETENGTSATIVTSKNGKIVSVTATVSPVAAESGEIVALPVEVLAAENTDDAVGIVVSIPDDAASVAVEISVVDVGLGNVAVIVNEDGTETLVQTSVVTENGVALILEGSQTVKIIENSKEFTDTEGHWAESSIDFVSARELFGGYTDGSFGPSNVMSRQLLWTVLARLDGYDTDGDAYGHGRQWAVSNGVSDGSNPTAAVTREQLVTMLWRYDGSVGSDFSLDYFDDRDRVADYADTAMAWAVQHGIVSGTSPTTLSPETTSDRAQLATILCRYVNGYKTIK